MKASGPHDIVFATNNAHKLKEMREIMGDEWNVLGLRDIGHTGDLPETSETLQGNALQKAREVKRLYGMDCFADDTGLLVDALGGEPGVYSARYASPGHDSEANVALLLERMEGKTDRSARFMTVIALVEGDDETLFEGVAEGSITTERHGQGGFGYDPVFLPSGSMLTFAEMTDSEKNAVSHRGRATRQLVEYLKKHNK